MESITWGGVERLLGDLTDAQRLALHMATYRCDGAEESTLSLAAAAVGLAWVSSPPMPKREGDLVAWGGACLSVLLTVAEWHEVVPDAYRQLADATAAFHVTEGEVEAVAGNGDGGTGAPSATG